MICGIGFTTSPVPLAGANVYRQNSDFNFRKIMINQWSLGYSIFRQTHTMLYKVILYITFRLGSPIIPVDSGLLPLKLSGKSSKHIKGISFDQLLKPRIGASSAMWYHLETWFQIEMTAAIYNLIFGFSCGTNVPLGLETEQLTIFWTRHWSSTIGQ